MDEEIADVKQRFHAVGLTASGLHAWCDSGGDDVEYLHGVTRGGTCMVGNSNGRFIAPPTPISVWALFVGSNSG